MSQSSFLFGRDEFSGTTNQYWTMYVPLLVVHTSLAMATIGLGATNMVVGLRRLRYGIGAGAMVAGVSRHRQLGHIMQWTFGGTLVTAYGVYLMLFHWFPQLSKTVRSKTWRSKEVKFSKGVRARGKI